MVAIIIVLLSILIVAVNAAARTAQRGHTRFLMNSIRQALIRFKDDVGYYPPVLDDDRGLFSPPDPRDAGYPDDVQSWFSRTSLAEYLLGYGEGAEDGYGYADAPTPETPPLGIRHPSRDGVWGATTYGGADGTLGARSPPLEGQVFGPYLQLKDERLLAAIALGIIVGLPVGIAMARNNRMRAVILPLLDVMQTMPSFVYLIPALMLFGLGKVPALLATVIYAAPPLIRLTDLGIRLVDPEIVEASDAFGA